MPHPVLNIKTLCKQLVVKFVLIRLSRGMCATWNKSNPHFNLESWLIKSNAWKFNLQTVVLVHCLVPSVVYEQRTCFQRCTVYTDDDIQHFNFQLTHTTLKKRRVIKTFLKQVKLLQHVSVYKETIIREPQPVLS